MNQICIAMNLPTAALSQYLEYGFNSMCTFQGVPLAGSDSGIFQLDYAGSNNGSPISAWFKPVTTDFGIANIKSMRKVVLGFESSGDIVLTMCADERRRRDYAVAAVENQRQHGAVVFGDRDIYGRYWSFTVRNVGGSEFAIDAISVTPIILNRQA